jgi:hypothetical protein
VRSGKAGTSLTEVSLMARTLTLIAACALILLTFAYSKAQDSASPSPSLGDLARQARQDKDKERANRPAAKVLTNDDLPAGGFSSSIGGGLGEVAQLPAGGKPGAGPSPAEKLAMMEALLDRVETIDRATLVRSVLKDKDFDFPGRSRWEERLLAARDSYVVQSRDLIRKARQIVAAADSMKEGPADPNDPRVKEMGARLQILIRDAVKTDSAMQAVVIEGRDLASQPATH